MKRWKDVMASLPLRPLVVTHHNTPQAVVLTVEHYLELVRSAQDSDPLLSLQQQFDSRLSMLDRPDASARLLSAFDSAPEEIGKMAEPPLFAG